MDGHWSKTHDVAGNDILTQNSTGLLQQVGGFSPHFFDLLTSRPNWEFGKDGGTAGNHDTAVYHGNYADYTVTAILFDTITGAIVPSGGGPNIIQAYKIEDHHVVDAADPTDLADGTDIVIGVDFLQFKDQTISLNNAAPDLKLHAYDSGNYLDTFSSTSYSNSNGPTSWTSTPWIESGDTIPPAPPPLTAKFTFPAIDCISMTATERRADQMARPSSARSTWQAQPRQVCHSTIWKVDLTQARP